MIASDPLKTQDPDKFLLGLFLSTAKRDAVAVIDMFNCELADIAASVTSQPMGMIKLQWWRDAIKRIYADENVFPVPLLTDLKIVFHDYKIPYEMVEDILTGREADLMEVSIHSLDDLRRYIVQIHGPVMQMKCKILGCDDITAIKMVEDFGLIGMIRAAPYYAERNKIFLPALRIADIAPGSAAFINVVRDMVTIVRQDLSHKPEDKYLRAMRALTLLYAGAMERANYDLFHMQPVAFKELRVWLGSH